MSDEPNWGGLWSIIQYAIMICIWFLFVSIIASIINFIFCSSSDWQTSAIVAFVIMCVLTVIVHGKRRR